MKKIKKIKKEKQAFNIHTFIIFYHLQKRKSFFSLISLFLATVIFISQYPTYNIYFLYFFFLSMQLKVKTSYFHQYYLWKIWIDIKVVSISVQQRMVWARQHQVKSSFMFSVSINLIFLYLYANKSCISE